jgi:hypothetical protein
VIYIGFLVLLAVGALMILRAGATIWFNHLLGGFFGTGEKVYLGLHFLVGAALIWYAITHSPIMVVATH